jgi:hypothetical protein
MSTNHHDVNIIGSCAAIVAAAMCALFFVITRKSYNAEQPWVVKD